MLLHWAALLPPASSAARSPALDAAGVAVWALQFTPRVAHLEEAVVLEVAQSIRLYGGQARLHELVESGAREVGVAFIAWAPTNPGALAFARAGNGDGFAGPLAGLLDPLALGTLSAVNVHAATLVRLGCGTLADVRRLPRGGITRRFGEPLLRALDQAYGLRPEAHRWVALPTAFAARLELPGRVETSGGLVFGARRLLLQMQGWLAARHSGVTAFTLRWRHDGLPSRGAVEDGQDGQDGEIVIRTAEPTRGVEHLCRLLAEHLAHVRLLAPVSDIEVLATEVAPIVESSQSFLPDTSRQGEALGQVLERIQARLGGRRVLRPRLVQDHRPEWMQRWQALDAARPNAGMEQAQAPQPAWILRTPMKLAMLGNRPLYQGPLLLLLGPDRVEGGWWHRAEGAEGADGARGLNVQRDYWVALSKHAGVLWIFRQRLGPDGNAWYLHGHFA